MAHAVLNMSPTNAGLMLSASMRIAIVFLITMLLHLHAKYDITFLTLYITAFLHILTLNTTAIPHFMTLNKTSHDVRARTWSRPSGA